MPVKIHFIHSFFPTPHHLKQGLFFLEINLSKIIFNFPKRDRRDGVIILKFLIFQAIL